MGWTKLLTGVLALSAFLMSAAIVDFVRAESSPHPALTGKVNSQAEGAMEGVIVGAKKVGSTMTTWVVSDAQGQYSFPRDRMEPGKYAVSIRAVGYELPSHFRRCDGATGPSGFAAQQSNQHARSSPCSSPTGSGS